MADNSKSFADKDAVVITLANQDVDGAKRTLQRIKNTRPDASLPILADPGASVAKEWKVFGLKDVYGNPDEYDIPSAFIINPERTIV